MFSFRSTLAVAPSIFALLALASSGCGGEEPRPLPAQKITINDFSASPEVVSPGQSTVLSYTVTNADTVKIDIKDGANVLPSAGDLTGTVTTDALQATTTFVLTAVKGEESATREVTVTVNATTNSARIDNLTATPQMVDRGGASTLAWMTTNATSGELRDEGNTSILTIARENLASGSFVVTDITMNRTITLVVRGDDNVEVTRSIQITVNGPQVISFNATPTAINPGDQSTLTWNVSNSTSVSISGSNSGQVVMNGSVPTGTFNVMPAATETFTLTAGDGLGGMATAQVTITVNAVQGAQVVSFTASPTTINRGDSTTLAWQVMNAPGGIEISDGANTIHISASSMASHVVRPVVNTTYTLRALNPQGNATATTSVTINPGAPGIISFTATPNPAAINGTTTLAWTTIDADSIRILSGATEIYTASGNTALMGTYVANLTASTTFTLEASNPRGGNTATVVVAAHNAPVINAFTVTPVSFNTMATAVLNWDVSNVSRLDLLANGSPATGFTPINTGTVARNFTGTFSLTVTQTTVFELVVRSGAGQANATATISTLTIEVEPNDTPMTAIPLPGNGAPVNGNIDPADDLDFYSVVVPEGGNVRAETSDGLGGCVTDTIITLVAPDGTTVVTDNDDNGTNVCSLIDPTIDFLAGDLAAGTYYIVVQHYDPAETGAYTLNVTVGTPRCGNLVLESRVGTPEQCDDGNTVAGDGCNSTCQIEPLQTITGPNNVQTVVPGAITPAGDADFIRIVMTSEGYIRAETFAPAAPSCTNTDTVLYLFNDDFSTQIGVNDEEGVGSCSLINPLVDTYARVPAGSYWLVVVDYENNEVIPAYTTQVRLLGLGCGNTLLDAGETCDDGNTNNNDGCSATCTLEGIPENENGGNNAANGAGVLTANGSTVFTGAIVPATDQDWYAVVVPQGYHLDAYVTANSYDSCAPAPAAAGTVTLYGTNGTTQLATDADSGPEGNCGRIWPYSTDAALAMNAGTYYLRVTETGANQTLTQYYLHIRVLAPGCGNTILEGAEQCEDGNTTPNDGCSAICNFEINPTIINPPGGIATASLATPEAFSLVRVNITQAGQSITAVAADSPGATTCNAIDTAIQLGDSTFGLLGTSLGGGPTGTAGECARINPTVQTFGSDLPIGTYYLAVLNENGVGTGSVELNVTVGNPSCGNGIYEFNAGEQCEDGNTVNGDGCTAQCAIEPDGVATLPAANPVVLAGAITPVGDFDIYRLTVTSPIYLIAETFAPNVAGGCTVGNDTVIRLYNSSFVELGNDDDTGINACSLINQQNPFAALAAGTYWITVEDYDNDTVIAGYEIRFSSVGQNVCGNGVPEGTESCDDGNLNNNDGCNSACSAVEDFGNNNTAATAQSLGTLAPGQDREITGSIALGDNDYFTFTLSAPTTAFLVTYLTAGNTNTCAADEDTELWIYNAVPTNLNATTTAQEPAIVAYDDDDGAGVCSQIDGVNPATTRINLAAGTYYVRVREYAADAPIAAYRLRIDL